MTNFPTSEDVYSDIVCGDSQNPKDVINNLQDAIEAIENKVGYNSDTSQSSHDYKLSEITGADKAVGKTAIQTLTNKTLSSPKINESVDLAATSTQLNYNNIATPGTAEATKTLVTDANIDINLGSGDITLTDITASGTITINKSVFANGLNINLDGSLTGTDWDVIHVNANANVSNQNAISWEFDSIAASSGPSIGATRTSATACDITLFYTSGDARVEAMRLVGGSLRIDFNSDSIRIISSKTPASAGATGTQGQIAWDANYIYVCTATNTWKRVAISTW